MFFPDESTLKFVCEVRIIAHVVLHLLHLQWDGAYWFDPLDLRNSERESEQEPDIDLWEDHAAYGPTSTTFLVRGSFSQLGLDLRMIRSCYSIQFAVAFSQ